MSSRVSEHLSFSGPHPIIDDMMDKDCHLILDRYLVTLLPRDGGEPLTIMVMAEDQVSAKEKVFIDLDLVESDFHPDLTVHGAGNGARDR